MKKIKVEGEKPYYVYIGENLLLNFGEFLKNNLKESCKIFVVTDNLVFSLYSDILKKSLEEAGFSVFFLVLENKEQSKNFSNLLKIYEQLFKFNMSKEDIILSFGGGMISDISGLCAATYKRGIRLINFPTTLLSQVDASIGGKNAINLEFGKNLVGTIYPPFMVFCDIALLKTLSKREFYSGFAEVIKYAVGFSKELFNILVKKDVETVLEEIIYRSIQIKKEIVEKDEFENDVRVGLNFGHTVGHALEKYYNFKIKHGEALALGMVYITKSSYKAGITKFEDFLKLKFILRKFNLKTVTNVDFEDIFKNVLADKKIVKDRINFSVIKNLGELKIMSLPIIQFKDFLRG